MSKLLVFKLRSSQSGMTMLELLIAMTIGLGLMAAILQVFLAGVRNSTLQEMVSSVSDKGQFALDYLVEDIRKAGFPGYLEQGVVLQAIGDLSNDTGGQGDRLVIRYQNDMSGFGGPAQSQDCLGQLVAAQNVINEYWLDADNQRLMCLGNGGPAAQSIIEGVESFQVLVGVDDSVLDAPGVANAEHIPTAYVRIPAAQALVNFHVGGPQPDEDIAPSQLTIIKSIRIGMLLASEANRGLTDAPPAAPNFNVLDEQIVDGRWGIDLQDGRIRRVFEATVAVRNARRSTTR